MTRTLCAVVSALSLSLVGCGMSVATPDVAAYQQSISALQTAVTAHQSDSASTTTSQDCSAEHQRYEGLARPQMGLMTNMSGGMDDCRRAMGHGGPFDMFAMSGSMQSELDRHAAAACTGDAAANHAEAARHCQLMRDWLGRQQTAVNSMSTGGGMMSGGRCSR